MSTDFEELLRAELDAERVDVPLDTDRVLTSGRRTVRIRRVGATVGGLAVLAVIAAVVIPLVIGRAVPAVPAPVSSPSATATRSAVAPLEGTVWRVTTIDGQPVTGVLTLLLDNGSFSGHGGCNAFAGTYRAEASQLHLSGLSLGAAGCSGTVGRQESAFVDALSASGSYEVSAHGLTLLGSDGTTLVELEPFTPDGLTWQVTVLDQKDLGDDSGLTLVVDGDHVRGSTVCVDYTADLTRNGTTWSVTNRQDVPGTGIPCPSGTNDRMVRYFDLLEQVNRAEVGPFGLTLTGPKGIIEFAVKH